MWWWLLHDGQGVWRSHHQPAVGKAEDYNDQK
jgi:hypothetical protein